MDMNASIDLDEIKEKIENYFKSLDEYEQYAWIGIGVATLMIIAGIILLIT